MKKILVKEEVCIGCRLCEIWCLVSHSSSGDIIKAFKEEKGHLLQRVRVEEIKPISFAIACRHCQEPECVYACISGAMYIDEKTKTIQHDQDRCVGCFSCILACPYGAILIDEREKKIVTKCDLCVGREIPACVENCPNGALILQDEV